MKRTQFAYNPYVLGLQMHKVESVAPDTKLPSLDTTVVRTRTSESSILTQHLSLKSPFVTAIINKTLRRWKNQHYAWGKTHDVRRKL